MAITDHERFTGYACKIDTNTINNVRSISPKFGVNKFEITPSGALDRLAIAAAYLDGVVSLTTGDIAALLAWCPPLTGYGSTGDGGLFQFQERADGGTFGTSHATITSPKVFAGLDEISVSQDAKEGATAKLTAHCLTDGTNPAVSMQVAQSLSGTVGVAGTYKLGGVVYEGSVVLGVQSIIFRTGLKYQTKRSSGFLDPDVGSIVERKPSIQVKGTNLTLAATIGTALEAVSSGLVIYLAKVAADGQPTSGSSHISITISAGTYMADGLNVSGTGDVDGTITADAQGASGLSFSTAAALPSSLP